MVRDTVKDRMGESLQSISHSAERIAADMLNEMTAFHGQVSWLPTYTKEVMY